MLQILGRSTSINVRKVLWLCAELDLPYAHEQWGSGFRSTDNADFLALNPNGKVPVIRDGQVVLWESNAICRYLAASRGRTDLLPGDAAERAVVEQWMDWQATELNSAWRYAFMALVRNSPAYRDPSAIKTSVATWNRLMSILDRQLARSGGYATGSTFTLADIVLGLATQRWFMTPVARPNLPAVDAYYDRLNERPGYREFGRNGVP
jgi:glutathione S-transferase